LYKEKFGKLPSHHDKNDNIRKWGNLLVDKKPYISL